MVPRNSTSLNHGLRENENMLSPMHTPMGYISYYSNELFSKIHEAVVKCVL